MNAKPIKPLDPDFTLGSYRLFRLFGFEVKLNLTWLLLALLIAWTLAAGLFPADYPGLAQRTYWWMGILGAGGVFLSIVLHELSHSLVARHFGLPIRGITLFIFGGVAEMEEEPVSPKVEFLMAAAGPLASFLLALILWRFTHLASLWQWPTAVVGVSHYLAIFNLIVAIFNLIPAFPLDGGRILRAALLYRQKDLCHATRIASQIGAGFGLVLMTLGGFSLLQGNFIGGMWWFLIGTFLRGAAKTSYQQLIAHQLLSGIQVRQLMHLAPITVSPTTTVAELVENYVYRHPSRMFPVVEDGKLLGCIATSSLKYLPKERWAQTKVAELLIPPSSENTVSPQADAAKLMAQMLKPNASTWYMVTDDSQFQGVISLQSLKELIALKLEIESPTQAATLL